MNRNIILPIGTSVANTATVSVVQLYEDQIASLFYQAGGGGFQVNIGIAGNPTAFQVLCADEPSAQLLINRLNSFLESNAQGSYTVAVPTPLTWTSIGSATGYTGFAQSWNVTGAGFVTSGPNNAQLDDGLGDVFPVSIQVNSDTSLTISGTPTVAGTYTLYYSTAQSPAWTSTTLTVTIATLVPPQPAAPSATPDYYQNDLAWAAVTDPLIATTIYNVYRSLDGVNFTFLASTTATTYTDADSGLTPYWYTVSASFNGTEGPQSPASTQCTPLALAAPAQPVVLAGDYALTIDWSAAPVTGAMAYNLYRGTSSGGETLIISGLAATQFTDTGLGYGVNQFYYVKAAANGVEGAASPESVPASPSAVTFLSASPSPMSISGGTLTFNAQGGWTRRKTG